MNAQKVLGVLDIYVAKMQNMSKVCKDIAGPCRADTTVRYPISVDNQMTKLAHVWWAIEQCRLFVRDGRMEKAFRWLGFIQGALWWAGLYSIDELVEHNKPKEETTDTSPQRNAKEWTDEELLSYVEIHCRTESALFSDHHIWRLLELANATTFYQFRKPEPDSNTFRAMHEDIALPLVARARNRIAAKAKIE